MRPIVYARLRPMRSPILLPMRMKAAETSASRAIADWTPLTVVWRSLTTAEMDTFISDVSTTSTNIAMANRMATRLSGCSSVGVPRLPWVSAICATVPAGLNAVLIPWGGGAPGAAGPMPGPARMPAARPAPTLPDVSDLFDAAAMYDEDYLHFFAPERATSDPAADPDVDLVWRLLALEPGMSVLDVGCGHGQLTNGLAARGCRVVGV